MIPTEGLNFINDVTNGIEAATPFYIGLFSGNYTPVLTDTAATFPAAASELTTEYEEATRPLYDPAASSGGLFDNSASPAVFTFLETVTVYGGAIFTTNTKGGTTGKLIKATLFTEPKTYAAGDVLNLPWYQITENLV
jgi:hypothetical protein